jgi:hypothetical protein
MSRPDHRITPHSGGTAAFPLVAGKLADAV